MIYLFILRFVLLYLFAEYSTNFLPRYASGVNKLNIHNLDCGRILPQIFYHFAFSENTEEKVKASNLLRLLAFWRRVRDSNSCGVAPKRFSSFFPSAETNRTYWKIVYDKDGEKSSNNWLFAVFVCV